MKNKISKEIGKRINIARLQLKLSQAKVGEFIGGDAKQICRYEKGETMPSIETLPKLAKTLNISLDYLILGDVKDEAKHNIIDREILRLFEQIIVLDKNEKEYIKKFLTGIILQNKLSSMLPDLKNSKEK